MAFRLANLVVDIGANTGPFDGALRRVRGALSATLSGLGSLARKGAGAVFSAFSSAAGLAATAMKAALVGVGVALAAGTAYAVDAASNLNETVSKVGVVFGKSADEVQDAARKMADEFGIPQREFLDAASGIGLMGKAAKLSQKDAARLSINLAKLGADAASFYNIGLDDALEKIRSGLAGEAEPLRALGVLLSEAAVGAEAVRMGLSATAKELSEGQKVQARASLITKGLADANGDLARTADGVANRFREMQGRFQNLAADLGQYLLPAVKRLTGALSGALKDFAAFVAANKAQLDDWSKWLEDKVGVGASAWKHWRAALDVVKEHAKEKIQNVKEIFDWLVANMPAVADRIRDAIVDGFEEGMKGAQRVVETRSKVIMLTLIKAPVGAIGAATRAAEMAGLIGDGSGKLAPRGKPRAFTDLKLSSNPGLAAAMQNFTGLHNADAAAEAAEAEAKAQRDRERRFRESNDDVAYKADQDRKTNPHHLRDMRESDEQKAERVQAENNRDLGFAIRDEAKRQRAEDWHRRHPYARGLAPGEAPAVSGAMRAPTAEMKFAMDRANQKVGVTDADAYQKELTEGALKSADIQKDMLKATTDQTAVLKEIAANTKGGSARGGAGTWG